MLIAFITLLETSSGFKKDYLQIFWGLLELRPPKLSGTHYLNLLFSKNLMVQNNYLFDRLRRVFDLPRIHSR